MRWKLSFPSQCLEFHFAVEMAYTVSHASHADSRSAFVDVSEFFGCDSPALVFDFESHSVVKPPDPDFGNVQCVIGGSVYRILGITIW